MTRLKSLKFMLFRYITFSVIDSLAQAIEHCVDNAEVRGSIPGNRDFLFELTFFSFNYKAFHKSNTNIY